MNKFHFNIASFEFEVRISLFGRNKKNLRPKGRRKVNYNNIIMANFPQTSLRIHDKYSFTSVKQRLAAEFPRNTLNIIFFLLTRP